ncbi:hypothetical protein [Pseudotabrizicola alkalilacus]|uniref:hypothetical protein n=1 Tax=Pseudotabrizicola alkalilacus TaxID=2305252 RepID=UPI001314ADD8|nr:hypothetical protein [Pseudotabrizicola alkalilacus]
MRSLVTTLIVFPLVFFLLILLVKPIIIFGSAPFNASMGWSVFGGIAGYVGVVFSLSAALGVSKLSDRYFAKSRLPDLQKKIVAINQNLTNQASSSNMGSLRSSQIVPQVGVALRSLERVKVESLNLISKSVAKNYETLKRKLDGMSSPFSAKLPVNDDPDFWALVNSLSELADEIETHRREEDARV